MAMTEKTQLITEVEAQSLAIEEAENLSPSEWVILSIKVLKCEFVEAEQEWKIEVRISFKHGDVFVYRTTVSPDGQYVSSVYDVVDEPPLDDGSYVKCCICGCWMLPAEEPEALASGLCDDCWEDEMM